MTGADWFNSYLTTVFDTEHPTAKRLLVSILRQKHHPQIADWSSRGGFAARPLWSSYYKAVVRRLHLITSSRYRVLAYVDLISLGFLVRQPEFYIFPTAPCGNNSIRSGVFMARTWPSNSDYGYFWVGGWGSPELLPLQVHCTRREKQLIELHFKGEVETKSFKKLPVPFAGISVCLSECNNLGTQRIFVNFCIGESY